MKFCEILLFEYYATTHYEHVLETWSVIYLFKMSVISFNYKKQGHSYLLTIISEMFSNFSLLDTS